MLAGSRPTIAWAPINWVGDNIAIERLGRAPTAAEEAEFKAAHDAEDEAYSAVLSYQPRTLAELHAKAKIFGSEGSVGEPFYIDADTALGFIATDIARLGEAG